MKLLRFLLLLNLMTPLAIIRAASQNRPTSPEHEPELLVQNLYRDVVARSPLGVPNGEDMKIFAPYLSQALLRKFDSANACFNDWRRQNPDPNLKPDIGWLELGPFSGENERASPQTFLVERTQLEKDGSFRVYVRLTRTYPDGPASIWQVAAIVIRENNHFVVNDVIYLKDQDYDESRLSKGLSAGCDGPRWIGFESRKVPAKK